MELLVIGLAAFWLRASASHVSVLSDQDEAVYVIQAQQWLRGGWPYVAVWDQHPVGFPAVLAVGGWLTGNMLLAARWGATLAVAVTAWLILRFTAHGPKQRAAGGVAALLYIVLLSRTEGLEAQTEVFNNALVCSASLLLFRAAVTSARSEHGDLPRVIAPGLILGCALQVKYVVFPECVLLCLSFLVLTYIRDRHPRRSMMQAATLVACGLAPTALAGGAYAMTGHLHDFLQANISANVTYAAMIPDRSAALAGIRQGTQPLMFPCLVFVACLVFVLCRPALARGRHDRTLMLWLGIWLVAAALDVCLPIKFWPHYFLALVTPLCVAASVFLRLLLDSGPAYRRYGLFVTAAIGLLVPPGKAALDDLATAARHSQFDIPRLIAGDVRRLGSGGGVYVFDYQPIIYLLSDVKPPTKYVFPVELSNFSDSSGAHPLAEFKRIMAQRPRFVVISDPPLFSLPDDIEKELSGDLLSYRKVAEYTDPNDLNRRVTLLIASPPSANPARL